MSALALEELSALAAIYCEPDECEVLAVSETHGITFRIQTRVKRLPDTDILLKLLFHLPVSYPSTPPNISVDSEQLTRAQCTSTEDGIWTVLLHLDHMRAKAKYVKTVEKWTSDLRLTGRLMFMGRVILILLQGDRNSIKEYLILQKTSKVDVDSSGKKCKEKMISVLCETKVQTQHKRYQAFEVKEYSTLDELQKEFEAAGLKELFSEFVTGLLK
ncbi:RWD domain-containing protein 3 [Alligator mississippiensis]|uniref:RWD domain-containing protein 3 n=1 Tax=Alligator mississippiensis TaxID=8496 RepID=A0A151M4X2_ALLMI|nr:RWD domain-containing protein 3 [Alligator mississippiensis]